MMFSSASPYSLPKWHAEMGQKRFPLCIVARRGTNRDVQSRDVLDLVGNRVEMPRNGTGSFCCGAGGGRFFMEEQIGKKVNIERSEEALATGAAIIATGCPFCFVMMDDGVKEIGNETVQVQDIAMLLASQALD